MSRLSEENNGVVIVVVLVLIAVIVFWQLQESPEQAYERGLFLTDVPDGFSIILGTNSEIWLRWRDSLTRIPDSLIITVNTNVDSTTVYIDSTDTMPTIPAGSWIKGVYVPILLDSTERGKD